MAKKQTIFTIAFTALAFSIILSVCSCESPPTQPCDEKVGDTKAYEDIVLNIPAIQELNSQLSFKKVSISNCFVDGYLGVVLYYQLPTSYSNYNITYADDLQLVYSKDGTLKLFSRGIVQNQVLESEIILADFQQKIQKLEHNPQVMEILSKTGPDPISPIAALYSSDISRSGGNRFQYNPLADTVSAYTLSNDVDWQGFPEIQLAHKIIKEKLLVGSLSDCSISHDELGSFTSMQTYDASMDSLFMSVALVCNGDWKTALVRMNSDGSYERLELEYEPYESPK